MRFIGQLSYDAAAAPNEDKSMACQRNDGHQPLYVFNTPSAHSQSDTGLSRYAEYAEYAGCIDASSQIHCQPFVLFKPLLAA